MREVVLVRDEIHVAEVDGRVVGFVALAGSVLEHLYVEPEAQSRGIGGALLALAKELRPEGFELWVFQRNEQARAFYERRGLLPRRAHGRSRQRVREPDARYEWRP